MKISNNAGLIAGASLAGLALIWWATRAGNAAKLAQGATRVAGEVAGGVVKGVGEIVGIPDTDQTQCQRYLAAGNYWDASFSCPAKDFIGGVFGSTAVSTSESADAQLVEELQTPEYYNLYP